MTIVYSKQPRDVVLLIGADDLARVWNNGSQVYLSKEFSHADSHAVMMTLRSGRNTILAKVTNQVSDHSLNLRFGTSALDSGRAFAEAKKWKEETGRARRLFAGC